jgi:hypothetical protein
MRSIFIDNERVYCGSHVTSILDLDKRENELFFSLSKKKRLLPEILANEEIWKILKILINASNQAE